VEKIFGGSYQNLARYLIDSKTLSKEEIEDIKESIRRRGQKIIR